MPLLNCLLMLSTNQPPDPIDEVDFHEQHSLAHGYTYMVTTRLLNGLTPHQSVIAVYGNARLNNQFLGRGTYAGYQNWGTSAAQAILANLVVTRNGKPYNVYNGHNVPAKSKGLIRLENFARAVAGQGLQSLGGTIRSSGLSLILQNIPNAAARIQVYYLTP
jgi:hypothetical protein